MRRTNIYITQQQWEKLRRMREETGLTVAELVRRAIDLFLEKRT